MARKDTSDSAAKNAIGGDEALRLAAQKKRNILLGLTLLGFVVLVGTMSALRLAENIQRVSGA